MKIGIRREDKNQWERRVPLTPNHVARLVDAGLSVVVQPSTLRVFCDQDYVQAGALLNEDLDDCSVVFGVKEIPVEQLKADKTYMFFAHVIKGQDYNMPMLQHLLDVRACLIDYEKVTDDKGRRLIFFGRHAGLAGMIDSLWALGQRLIHEGFETPLSEVQMAHSYDSLGDAKQAIEQIGEKIRKDGLPDELCPLTVGFAGYGNVSVGAQEIFDLLPHRAITPEQLTERAKDINEPFGKVVFREEHMATPLDPQQSFVLQDYYDHPECYRGIFARYVPQLHMLINCIYWTPRYPRLVSRDLLWGLYAPGQSPRLKVIGDISIDIEGAIECSLKSTDPGNPVYVYLPEKDRIVEGVEGRGPVVLAVDNLPCELPKEASQDFGDALVGFIKQIAQTDFTKPHDQLDLPPEIQRALITHQGDLMPNYSYLQSHLEDKECGCE